MEDDRAKTVQMMQAAIFGRNKKRQRHEVDGLEGEDMDELEKMKRERI